MSQLYYGDNLDVLRSHIADESVDLIYLDPPFNSNANYNILFKSPKGAASDSQIEAFEDSWHYGAEAAQAFHEVMESGRTEVANLLRAMQDFLGQNDMMAYLVMMAARLIELHRVLKPTGSLYLHCDPTASHYLKLLLDGVFGAGRFRNEIIWKRTTPKGLAFSRFASNHDVILVAQRGDHAVWNPTYSAHSEDYLARYNLLDAATGRRFQATSLINPNANRPNLTYEFGGHLRVWRWTRERMEAAAQAGLVYFPPNGGVPREKRFLDEQEGVPLSDVWTDIPPLNSQAQERLGYPTQKPLALLERIIAASSNPGDVVLDPFCGCGTAVHAAQKLGRRWIGIDVTYLAIGLIERRLKEAFPGIDFEVVGEPKGLMDAEHLAASEPYQFQYWVTQKIGGQPYQGGRKGADRGIDGYIYYTKNEVGSGKSGTAAAIISVKAGRHIGVAMIRDLKGVLAREKADLGIFVCVANPSREMEREAAAAGLWTDPVTGANYPRVQIFTLAELFRGRSPRVPLLDRQAGYRKAKRETEAGMQAALF